jgi:hypothetical protein
MKQITGILIALGFMLFISCSENDVEKIDERKDTRIIDLELTKSYLTDYDMWIIATDLNGNILASKQCHDETLVTLNAQLKPDEKVNLIIFYGDKSTNAVKSNNFKAYTNVEPGRKWQIGKIASYTAPTAIGSSSFQIDNIPNQYLYSIQVLGMQGDNSMISSPTHSGNSLICDLNFYNHSDNAFFSFVPGSEDPLYFETDTLQEEKSYNYDFNKIFSPFKNILSIPSPKEDFIVFMLGGVKNNSWNLQCTSYRSEKEQLKIGYNDGYEKYYAFYFYKRNGKRYTFSTFSDKLTADDFTPPNDDFTVLDSDMSQLDFTIDINRPLEYRVSSWSKYLPLDGGGHGLQIFLFGDQISGGLTLKKFPEEMITIYPELESMDNLTYGGSTFQFDNGAGNSYKNSLEKMFDDPVAGEDFTPFYQVSE